MRPLIDESITNQEYEKNVHNIPILITLSFRISISISYFDLDKIVNVNIDILCKAETKLDESFPNNQLAYQYNQSIYTRYYRQQRWLHGIWLNHTYLQGGLTV